MNRGISDKEIKMDILIKKKRVSVIHVPFVRHIRDGKVIWEQRNLHNLLHDEGEQALLSAYFATAMSGYGAPPANLYLGLDARAVLAEADDLTTLSNEEVGNNYARQALSTGGTGLAGQDFYINQPAAYYRADGKVLTFTATTAPWSAKLNMFLCTVASGTAGKLISSLVLTASRTLQIGDSLQASILTGLAEP
jgi:hypothetical protein